MRVGGARPPPLITFALTSKVAVYAPAEWADDTLTLFHLYQYMSSVEVTMPNYLELRDGIYVNQNEASSNMLATKNQLHIQQ